MTAFFSHCSSARMRLATKCLGKWREGVVKKNVLPHIFIFNLAMSAYILLLVAGKFPFSTD